MNINNNIFKKVSFWTFVAVIVIVVGIVIAFETNPISDHQYQFPLKTEDIEKVLAEQGIDMVVVDSNTIDDSINVPALNNVTINIATLRNDDNITFGISSQDRDNHKVLNLTWYLPKTLSSEQVNDFFYNELSKQFELAGIFYGNKKELDKELDILLDYYLDEQNYNNSFFWNKRTGNDHLGVRKNNQIISMLIIPDEIYEAYLNSTNEAWKNTAEIDNINIYNSTIAEMKETVKEDIPVENESNIVSQHFVIKGQLKNIKENKKVPAALININSNYLMPNKDKYLSAKLVDNTGSVDVLLQMTSLKPNQLSMERNHNVVVLYNNNEPVYVVRFSTLD